MVVNLVVTQAFVESIAIFGIAAIEAMAIRACTLLNSAV